MAKFNEGDIIEGIFAIVVAYMLSNGRVSKDDVNALRVKIEPSVFATGRFTYDIAKNARKKKPARPADNFNVSVSIRLKPARVFGAFGEEYRMFYARSEDIGNIDQKIDSLIENADPTKSDFARRLMKIRNDFLNNDEDQTINFNVIADGISGESSGGDIKGDVVVNIEVIGSNDKKSILRETVPFSVKSESTTISNLGPYNGMMNLAKTFDIKWNDAEKYSYLKQNALSDAEKKKKIKLTEKMFSELKTKILATPNINNKLYAFLKKSLFGSDLASIVDVGRKEVKEITHDYFDYLVKNVKLKAVRSGPNLLFVEERSRTPIFQLRLRFTTGIKADAKLLLELRQGIHSIKKKKEAEEKAKKK